MGQSSSPKLTPLESLVMNCLWECSPATVRQVRQALEPVKPMAYTTVLTVMRILRDKGFLQSVRQGRADLYSPAVAQQEVARTSLRELLERFFAGSATALVSQLLDSQELDADEIRDIRRQVNRKLRESD
jgi:BlaI family transcriptional regulator, penicillinase repressor